MSKAIQLAEKLDRQLTMSMFAKREDLYAQMAQDREDAAIAIKSLIAQLEAAQSESVRLAAQLAEEKLRADRMTEQHRMQASISAAAQSELAAIRSLEPVAHENANGVVRRAGYQWAAIEKLTALYALPEQK